MTGKLNQHYDRRGQDLLLPSSNNSCYDTSPSSRIRLGDLLPSAMRSNHTSASALFSSARRFLVHHRPCIEGYARRQGMVSAARLHLFREQELALHIYLPQRGQTSETECATAKGYGVWFWFQMKGLLPSGYGKVHPTPTCLHPHPSIHQYIRTYVQASSWQSAIVVSRERKWSEGNRSAR